ncbi:hypothetical protein SUGI_0509500 [Cryptomeria japonica]|nr:hypothetical protein SUGI_0509500 [Cryptomeria japonica]
MYSYPANGAFGGRAIIWDPTLAAFEIDRSQANWMSGWVKGIKNNLRFLLINVYGPIQNRDNRRIWNEIELYLKAIPNQICIIGGDFIAILDHNNKRGGRRIISQSERDFCDWVHKTNVMEIKTVEDTYTWNNMRRGFSHIAEKLDRFFLRGSLIDFHNSLSTDILPILGLDHYPIQLSISEEVKPKRCPFKFEQMWLKDDKVLGLIEKWWKGTRFLGSKLYRVLYKFKRAKNNLLRWNKTHFGNIFEAKVNLEEEMSKINNMVIEKGMDEALYLKEK